MAAIGDITAIVLAGGKGARLAGVYPHLPKPMVPACGEPFLHWVTAWLVAQGVRDIVYSTGHLAEQIETWASAAAFGAKVRLRCRREASALGTGGGVVNCLDLCSDPFLVVNADSLLMAPIAPLATRLDEETIDGAMQGLIVGDAARYGKLELDGRGLLRSFMEKRPGRGLINGGVYLMRRRLVAAFAPAVGPSSVENDMLPTALAHGARIAVEVAERAPFLDIGTPESVVLAEAFIAKHAERFCVDA